MRENLKLDDREKVFDILIKVLYEDAFSNLLLKNTDFEVRAFATDLVYGVIERKMTLDEIIRRLSKINYNRIDKKTMVLLYMGLYQLIYSRVKDYAAINEVVEIAKKFLNQGAAGFINGILRSAQRQEKTLLQEVYNMGWEYEFSINVELLNMIKELKLNTREILESTFKPPRVHLYVRKNMENILRALDQNNIKYNVKNNFVFVENYDHKILSSFFRRGEYSIMDYSTSVIRQLVPKDTKTVFDMCAAPGGKTLMIADLLPNAKIKSSDINEIRVNLIHENIKRWGLNNVTASVNDARVFDGNKYDLVVCDVMCSGSGVISRKPELKYKIDYKMIEELNSKQIEILKNASNQVNDGGYVIYSTCSILKRENSDIVDEVCKDGSLKKIKDILVIPSSDSEGFYACLLKKK